MSAELRRPRREMEGEVPQYEAADFSESSLKRSSSFKYQPPSSIPLLQYHGSARTSHPRGGQAKPSSRSDVQPSSSSAVLIRRRSAELIRRHFSESSLKRSSSFKYQPPSRSALQSSFGAGRANPSSIKYQPPSMPVPPPPPTSEDSGYSGSAPHSLSTAGQANPSSSTDVQPRSKTKVTATKSAELHRPELSNSSVQQQQ